MSLPNSYGQMPDSSSVDNGYLLSTEGVLQEVAEFENKMMDALRYKYRGAPPQFAETILNEQIPVSKIDIKRFCDLYSKQTDYPAERLSTLAEQLMDIKMQLYYITEVDIGLYNLLIFDKGVTIANISANPHLALLKLSLDQNVIVKSRILWERVMNFVYYLETGDDLVSRKSKKTAFFKFIAAKKWSFLGEYKAFVEWFDDKLRTPEVHKRSVLRRHFLAGDKVVSERMTAMMNIVMNVFWQGLFEIIQGRKVRSKFWCSGMDAVTPCPSFPAVSSQQKTEEAPTGCNTRLG